jgi:hypothetical protein
MMRHKEDTHNYHDSELHADEDDNEEDYDGSLEDDDNNVEDEADNMLTELLNFPVFPCMAHCLQLVVTELAKSQIIQ